MHSLYLEKAVIEILFCGIDIGSTTSKSVIIDENKNIIDFSIMYTTFNRDESGRTVFEASLKKHKINKETIKYIVSTGYGRKALTISDKAVPEIICHAAGTKYLVSDVKTIIDIGGQDSKVISMDENGMILKFEMNDKCAAGTGRFFEVLTNRLLNISMDELGPLSLKSNDPCTISSMCTVFAETEIISFLSEGRSKEDIIAGMNKSIAKRVVAMGKAGQVQFEETIIFSGGVANNVGAIKALEDVLQKPVKTIKNPQITGALGAALIAHKEYIKQDGGE